jgi:hypothetical protein
MLGYTRSCIQRVNDTTPRRRGGRVAEGAGLLNQYAGNRIEGSNPSLSANISLKTPFRNS